MSIFNFFQSDEVTFLSNTFAIKLTNPKQKDLDIGDLHKHIKSVESQIEKHKRALHTMFVHPVVAGTDVESDIRKTLKDQVVSLLDDLEDARKFVSDGDISNYEQCLSKMNTKTKLLESHVDFHTKAFKSLTDSEKKKEEKRKELQKSRQELAKCVYELDTALQELEKCIETIGTPPEIRNTDFEALKKTLEEQKIAYTKLKETEFAHNMTFSKLLHLVTAEVLSLSLQELLDCQASYRQAFHACTFIRDLVQKSSNSWEGNIKELFPEYLLLQSDYEKTFHKYEEIRTVIQNSYDVEEEIKESAIKSIDQFLHRLLDPKNKPPKGKEKTSEKEKESQAFRDATVAEVSPLLEKKKNEWSEILKFNQKLKEDGLNALNTAEEAMKKYFPAMIQAQKTPYYDDKINALRALIPIAKYESIRVQAKILCAEIEKDVLKYGEEKITFKVYIEEHYLSLKSNISTDSLKELGFRAQNLEQESLRLAIPLPNPYKEIDASLRYLNKFHDNPSSGIGIKEFEKTIEAVKKKVDDNAEKIKNIKTAVGMDNSVFSNLKEIEEKLNKQQKKLDAANKQKTDAEKLLAKALGKQEEYKRKKNQIKSAVAKAEEELKDATLGDDEKTKIEKLIKRLKKAAKEVRDSKPGIQKELEGGKADLRDANEDLEKLNKKIKEGREKLKKKQKDAQNEIMEQINPEIAALVKKWDVLTSKFAADLQEAQNYLDTNNLSFLAETIIDGGQAMHDGYQNYWSQNMSTENVSSLTDLLRAYERDVIDELASELKMVETEEDLLEQKQSHIRQMKGKLIQQIQEQQRRFPSSEEAPDFNGESLAQTIIQKIGTIDVASLTKENEGELLAVIEACRADVEHLSKETTEVCQAQEKKIAKEISVLKDLRDVLKLEVQTRIELAKDTFHFVGDPEKFIKMAFGSLLQQLNEITDPYIDSVVHTNLGLDIKSKLSAISSELKKVDFADPAGLSASYEQLSKDISSAQKSLAKEKVLKETSPNEHKILLDRITALNEKWEKQSIDISKQDLTTWKVMFANSMAIATNTKDRIKALEGKAGTLQQLLKENESYLKSYPKLLKHLQAGISNIKVSKIKTVKEFDAAESKYQYYIDLLEKSLNDPATSQEEESMLHLQEEIAERQKEDWLAFLSLFEGNIMKQLKDLVAQQLASPSFPDNERSALKQYRTDAEQALKEAKKAGEKEAYKEGRSHLSRIRGVLQRLQRFPNGVNAEKLKSLQELSKKWKEALLDIQGQCEKIKNEIERCIRDDQNLKTGLSSNDVHAKIDGFIQKFQRFNFEIVTMKLKEGNDIKSWKENGLAQVRDIRTLIDSPLGRRITGNPFDPIEWGPIKKGLNTIEKSILLYRGK